MDDELTRLIEELEKDVEGRDFLRRAMAFETALKANQRLRPEERQKIWSRYQAVRTRRKMHLHVRREEADRIVKGYQDKLWVLDLDPHGPNVFGIRGWDPVAHKIDEARKEISRIRREVATDGRLFRDHREQIRGMLDTAWRRVEDQARTLQCVHADHARTLYREALDAVETRSSRESRDILKANTREFGSLFLSQSDRRILKECFDEVWRKWREKQTQEAEEWKRKTRERLAHREEKLDRKTTRLERIRDTIAVNEERRSSARTPEFEATVDEWIAEGREQECALEEEIEEIEHQIRRLREQLGDS